MFIVLAADTYVRPHRHLGKSESFHVIRGRGRVLLFDEDGSINRVICLAEPGRGEAFYYRLAEPRFHTVLVDESPFVIHETTTGPFRAGDAEQAAWAPAPDDDSAKIREYVQGLRRAAAGGLQP
jgi:cupin fold WbuC family metalloprotein